MDWIELAIDVDPAAADVVSEMFARVGYGGGVVVEQELLPLEGEPRKWEELAPPEIDPTRPVSVRTYLPGEGESTRLVLEEVREELRKLGQLPDEAALRVRPSREEDWANAWKAYYDVQRVGKRIVIKPSWLEYTPQEGDVVLDLDPGMAFGTGLHATTRLCLAALEDYETRILDLVKDKSQIPNHKSQILDLGTGSGILAIAAAKLGGPETRVLALDTDVIAVDATRQNVERNGLAGQISVDQGSASAAIDEGCFDLVVANILASVIIDLASDLARLVKPGGILITSGIIEHRGDAVVAALERVGLPVREKRQEADWLCLVSVREP